MKKSASKFWQLARLGRHTPQAGRVAAEQLKAQASTRILEDFMMEPFRFLNYNDRQVELNGMGGL